MWEHHGDGLTRRDVLIGAAGGLALAAVDASGALAQDALASRSPASCSRTATFERVERRQSGPCRLLV